MVSRPNKYIVFEGPDGCGKTTVSKMIFNWMRGDLGINADWYPQPGATDIGQVIRKLTKSTDHVIDPNTEALLMGADNSAFINQILIPKLDQGDWVISDRNNFISSLAYQIAGGCDLDHLIKVHEATATNPPKIDLLLVFRANRDKINRNKSMRHELNNDNQPDRFEDQDDDYTSKVLNTYENLIEDHSDLIKKFVDETECEADGIRVPKAIYIDANQSLTEVFETVKDIVSKYFSLSDLAST